MTDRHTTLISAAELAQHVDDVNWAIVDCRYSLTDHEKAREDYLTAHVPGAVHARLNTDLAAPVIPGVTGRHPLPDADTFAQTLGAWGIDDDVQVVAYDDAGGAFAARLWWMLRWMSHDAVAVLDGGWSHWLKVGGAVQTGEEVRPSRSFIPSVRPELVVTTAEVSAWRTDTAWRIIDARAKERYRGEVEPIDPVAGHIPGALNCSYPDNLGVDGRFLASDALRVRFDALLGDHPPDHTVFYCGSGITAAHNLLAYAHAGLGDARLYAGSWSEWITDSSRPIATTTP